MTGPITTIRLPLRLADPNAQCPRVPFDLAGFVFLSRFFDQPVRIVAAAD